MAEAAAAAEAARAALAEEATPEVAAEPAPEEAAESAPEAPPEWWAPRCTFNIAADCVGLPAMNNAGWFLDSDKGGPASTNLYDCDGRKQAWEATCESPVEMSFSDGTEEVAAAPAEEA